MNPKNTISATLLACLFTLPASAAERTWAYDDFDAIDIDGCFDLTVKVGSPFSIVAEGDAEAFDNLDIEVDNEVLEIELDDGCSGPPKWDFAVTITMPRLTDAILGKGLVATIGGVDSDQLRLKVTSGAELDIEGQCYRLKLGAHTGAQVDAKGLQCEKARVKTNTGAEVEVFVTDTVKASAHLGAQVRIYGDPEKVSRRETLGGNVDQRITQTDS